MPDTTARVARLLADIALAQPELHTLLQTVRALVLQTPGTVGEEVKYGGVLFSCGTPFCGLFVYRAHVTLEFSQGAELPDAYQVLEGKGKGRRHIKLHTLQDVHDKHVGHYVRLAIARCRQGA